MHIHGLLLVRPRRAVVSSRCGSTTTGNQGNFFYTNCMLLLRHCVYVIAFGSPCLLWFGLNLLFIFLFHLGLTWLWIDRTWNSVTMVNFTFINYAPNNEMWAQVRGTSWFNVDDDDNGDGTTRNGVIDNAKLLVSRTWMHFFSNFTQLISFLFTTNIQQWWRQVKWWHDIPHFLQNFYKIH